MEYLALNNADASVDLQALPSNFRLSFFRALKKRQDLELAFNTRIKNNGSEMAVADQEASFCFSQWRTADSDLYVAANREYIKLRSEKPEGPYRKKALYFNLRPVLHNIISYHLTGREFYRTQVRQNLAAVRQRLAEREFYELDRFIQILLADLQHGPALFG
jgi:hypothetical protein